MDALTIFFLICLVAGLGMAAWIKSGKGKKWLASL